MICRRGRAYGGYQANGYQEGRPQSAGGDLLLRLKSVTRTAEALGMSQPAMSLALNKLRSTFDDPLFVRASRGIWPTPRAEQLAVPLRHGLDQHRNDVLRQPSFDAATTRRTFTFNMADVGEMVFLPRIAPIWARGAGATSGRSPPPHSWRKP
jgi:DNA-binding transcriptional LysR family regulator